MEDFKTFISHWQHTTLIWAEIFMALSVLILLFYFLMLSTKSSLTKKHTYMSAREIKSLSNAGLAFTLAIIFFTNSVFVGYETIDKTLLIFKTVVTVALGFAVGYAINAYLRFYYPFILEKRLNKIRFKPRVNPNTGDELKLLNEDEEDEYLTKEMIEQEMTSEYEYDVWLDEKTGYKLIETYEGQLHMQICNNCNFRTCKEYKHDIIQEPTGTESGKVMKYYRCTNCDHEQKKEVEIPPLANG